MNPFKAKFDGKVIVPDEPLDLPKGTPVLVSLNRLGPDGRLQGTPGKDLFKHAGLIPKEDLEAMAKVIEEEFGYKAKEP